MLVNCMNWLTMCYSVNCVTDEVKAVCVGDRMEVSGGKKKQDLVVADATGCCRVTIREEELEECIIKKIDDIGSAEENSENEDDGGLTMGMRKKDVRVISVDIGLIVMTVA